VIHACYIYKRTRETEGNRNILRTNRSDFTGSYQDRVCCLKEKKNVVTIEKLTYNNFVKG